MPCLTIRDLQFLGVCNRAHQRLILSVAVHARETQFPAAHQAARPQIKAPSAALTPTLSTLTPPTCNPPLQTRDQHQTGSVTTDAVLPNKALPRGGLLSIASALAASLTKTAPAAAPNSSRLATAQHAMHASHAPTLRLTSCIPLAAKAAVAGAGAPAVCPRPPQASATSRAVVGSVRGASGGVRGIAHAVNAVPATAVSAPTTAGVGTATARRCVITSEGAQALDKAAAVRAVATVVKAAVVPAPQTKAEEARQLAMALSASMSAGESTIHWPGCYVNAWLDVIDCTEAQAGKARGACAHNHCLSDHTTNTDSTSLPMHTSC